MIKRTTIISLAATLVFVASIGPAQAREFRTTKQKAGKPQAGMLAQPDTQPELINEEAKAKPQKNQKEQKPQKSATLANEPNWAEPVDGGQYGNPGLSSKIKDDQAEKQVKKNKTSFHSTGYVTPLAPTTSKSAYAALINDQTLISEQIGVLSSQLQGASSGKAKKISAKINELTDQLSAIERRMATFPESIKNPTSTSIMEVDAQFNRELDAIVAAKVAASDPYAGSISNDPQLEKMYRQRLGDNALQNDPNAPTYRVMIAISKSPLPKSTFSGMEEIIEQRMPNGGIVYYQGAYKSRSDAERACNQILAARKFRDAFVVAMQGDRRIALQ